MLNWKSRVERFSVWRNSVARIPVETVGTVRRLAIIEEATAEFPVMVPVETEFPVKELNCAAPN